MADALVPTCPRKDSAALKAWLLALAKGPAVRVRIGLGGDVDIVIHSAKLRELLRAVPKDFRSYFTTDRLVLAWDGHARHGCLRIKRLATQPVMGDILEECFSILARRAPGSRIGGAKPEQKAALVRATGVAWKYLQSYTCEDVCARITASNAAKAVKGCVSV
jgi:hypothetical protein